MATLSWRLLLHTMLRVWLVAFRDQKPAAISSPAPRPGQSSQASMGMVVVGGAGQHLGQGGSPFTPISPAILAPESLSSLRVKVVWG